MSISKYCLHTLFCFREVSTCFKFKCFYKTTSLQFWTEGCRHMGIPHVDMVTVGFKIQISKEVSIRSKTFRQWLCLLCIYIKASKTNFLTTTFLFSSLFLLHHSISIKLHIFKIVPSFCQILNRKSFRYSLSIWFSIILLKIKVLFRVIGLICIQKVHRVYPFKRIVIKKY